MKKDGENAVFYAPDTLTGLAFCSVRSVDCRNSTLNATGLYDWTQDKQRLVSYVAPDSVNSVTVASGRLKSGASGRSSRLHRTLSESGHGASDASSRV